MTVKLEENSLFDETEKAYDVNYVKLFFSTTNCDDILEKVKQSKDGSDSANISKLEDFSNLLRLFFSELTSIAADQRNPKVLHFARFNYFP